MRGRVGWLGLAAAILGCEQTSEEDPLSTNSIAVLGVMHLVPEWTPGADEIDFCASYLDRSPHSARIILDTERWTELALPLMVRNGGPARARGSRYFDESRTPTGAGVSSWTCTGDPTRPSSSGPISSVDAGSGAWSDLDAGLEDGDAIGRWWDEDGGFVWLGDAEAEPTPYVEPETELILHRRDPSRSFCKTRLPSEPWVGGSDVEPISVTGDIIYGGQIGRVVSEAIPKALGEDIAFEFMLADLARACCRESGDESCKGPLVGGSCDELALRLSPPTSTSTAVGAPELAEPLEVYAARLVSRPSTLWMQLNLHLEFVGPYEGDAPEYASYWIRLGFCRGCGGQAPREGDRPDPVLECLARRAWEPQ